MFQLWGPLFFGVAGRLTDGLDMQPSRPRAFILRVREVPFIDTAGVAALADFVRRDRQVGTTVIVTGVQPQPLEVMHRMGLTGETAGFAIAPDFAHAIEIARAG